jgi:putative spermidine/putrescine transport system substrate-binding protein
VVRSEVEKMAFVDPFAKEKGIEIANVSPTNYAKLKAMVEANAVDWDVVTVGGYFIIREKIPICWSRSTTPL